MAAATAVLFDPTPPEMIVEHRRARGSERGLLEARIEALHNENRALARRNRELERELLLTRIDSGELSPPSTIEDASSADLWLAWAERNHHPDACSCHRCTAARRVL